MKSQARVALGLLVLPALLAGSCGDDDNNPAEASLALSCSANPATGTAPLAVAFSVNVTGQAESFEVQYGDGSASNNPSAGHLYSSPGSYQATIIATGGGQQESCRVTITVLAPSSVNGPPEARFLFRPAPADGRAPLRVVANMCESTDPDGDELFFTYVWGDGGFHDGGRCVWEHVYQKGVYKLTACVGDQQPGHSDTCETRNVIAR